MKIKTATIDKRNEKERLLHLVKEQTRDLHASQIAIKNLLFNLRKESELNKKNDEIIRKSEES